MPLEGVERVGEFLSHFPGESNELLVEAMVRRVSDLDSRLMIPTVLNMRDHMGEEIVERVWALPHNEI
jgi:hypothetical protein